MLIETEISFTDDKQSRLLGKEEKRNAPFLFELNDVSGIMPGDNDGKTSIIFLSGTDLLINLPYKSLARKYADSKGQQNMQLSHEG